MKKTESELTKRIDIALNSLIKGRIPEGIKSAECGDGDLVHLCKTLNRLINASAKAQAASLTEKKALEKAVAGANEMLKQQATTDALTGVPNRQKFNAALKVEMSRSRRQSIPLSLIIFDIDHFKLVNDSFGHRAGDVVLQELAGLIVKEIRSEDILARWGGEEFVILMPHTDLRGGRIFAERLCSTVRQNSFSAVGQVTCSFGVSTFDKADTEESLVTRADRALYRAKETGRNRVEAQRQA